MWATHLPRPFSHVLPMLSIQFTPPTYPSETEHKHDFVQEALPDQPKQLSFLPLGYLTNLCIPSSITPNTLD